MTPKSSHAMRAIFPDVAKPVIGMLHLPPLPGAPGFGVDASAVRSQALRDAKTLASAGVGGLMLENFGDVPFFAGHADGFIVGTFFKQGGQVFALADGERVGALLRRLGRG